MAVQAQGLVSVSLPLGQAGWHQGTAHNLWEAVVEIWEAGLSPIAINDS